MRTDRAVLQYLKKRAQGSNDGICKTSIPKIAVACDISERQVQISTTRLIRAGLIERMGYDFSNPDTSKRGTVYRILNPKKSELLASHVSKKGSIKLVLVWCED